MRKLILCLVAAAFLTGCGGDFKLSASTEAALKSSLIKMVDSLPKNKKDEVLQAVTKIALSHGVTGKQESKARAAFRKHVHGKTADQLISIAAGIKMPKMPKMNNILDMPGNDSL
ncbi:hypothetical protein P0136_00195 [Lentisphaerota bacterium ZTH]|nr:hypothetical protein JYG24_08660 [Lentisphaerota bacterium]WET06436.1 hypothetical protein P0136_00195 [Lentisphaerota bacterium ZTH]